MSAWKNFALLQPIDSKWLPLDFKFWRFGMLTTNGAMVLTEMPAWGFVASVVFGGGTLGCIAGFIVGLIMGGLIWTADAGIATADLQSTRRFSLMASARLLFLIISVAFTARYIATFVLTADIQNEWNKRTIALMQQKRAELFNKKIGDLNHAIDEKHQALDLEVEGRRKSGIVGCGSICKQLQADLVDLNSQLDKVKEDENEFDRLAANPEANAAAIAAKYGLAMPPLTMKARNEILAELTKQPGYRATELTIRAWCVLVFLAMLLAKLAQPESAKLVYMQSLRPDIAKYEAGELDSKLLPQYRSMTIPRHMTLAYLLDRKNYFRANEIEQKKLDLINGVKAQLQTVRGEVAAAEEQVDLARRAFSESQNRRNAVQDGIIGSERSLAEIEMARRSLEQSAFSPQRVHEMVELAKFEQAALRQKDELRREFETVAGETARREATLHAEEQMLAAIKERMWLAEKELHAMQWSVARAAATEFSRLIAGEVAPAALGQRAVAVAKPESQQPLRSLADSGKAVIAGLLDGRIPGAPAPTSLLRRTVSAYLHSKLVTICAIVALVCAVVIATSFFAHSVLAQLH
jgi:hypothetical protein